MIKDALMPKSEGEKRGNTEMIGPQQPTVAQSAKLAAASCKTFEQLQLRAWRSTSIRQCPLPFGVLRPQSIFLEIHQSHPPHHLPLRDFLGRQP